MMKHFALFLSLFLLVGVNAAASALSSFDSAPVCDSAPVGTDSVSAANSSAPPTEEKNNWGGKLIKSPFGLGLDIQTKYMWRGMEMMTEDSAPVLFPSINYSWKGLFLSATGAYAVNGKFAEIDLAASYTWNGLSIGFIDYYFPTTDSAQDKYFGGGRHTGHWLEAVLSYDPDKIPLHALLANYFYGADKYTTADGKEKQAYSTYLEIGTYYDFLHSNRIGLNIGAALNRSCYNGYEHDFSICNVELKYTYTILFRSGWTLPLTAAYIYNPVYDKSFVNLTASFAF